jgi:hypothetical protein
MGGGAGNLNAEAAEVTQKPQKGNFRRISSAVSA